MASSPILALMVLLLVAVATADETCVFSTDDGSKLNLSGMTGQFNTSDSKGSSTIYYSPCKAFSNGGCSNVMVCLKTTIEDSENVGIGNSTSSKLERSGHVYTVTYTQEDWKSIVALKCDPAANSDTFKYISNYEKIYTFELASKRVCLQGPSTSASPKSSPSTSAKPKTSPSTSASPKTTQSTSPTPKSSSSTKSSPKTSPSTSASPSSSTKSSPKTSQSTSPTPKSSSSTKSSPKTSQSTSSSPKSSSSSPASPKYSSSTKSSSTGSSTPRSTDTTTHSGSKSVFTTLSMGAVVLIALLTRNTY